jgi:hypothetical protein
VNILGAWLTGTGHPLAGACILIGAKLVGTAVLARLFALCRPSLLTVNWFRRVYEGIGRVKQRLYSSGPWQAVVRWKNRIKERLQRLTHRWRGGHLKRRWRALRVVLRRKWRGQPRVAARLK